MSKTVTLRLKEDTYKRFKKHAEEDNRPLSNFIETATERYIEEIELTDEFETEEIKNDSELIKSLKDGYKDIESGLSRKIG